MPRYTIVGPPGTGKTEFLRRQVEVFADRDGIAPEEMVVCSLTRTAASVLRGRLPIPDSNAATLHSLAYRALGMPELAEKGKLAREWNALPGLPAAWQLAERSADDDAPVDGAGGMMALYSRWRGGLRRSMAMGEVTKQFAQRWEDYKKQTGSYDFSDMLEQALWDRVPIPHQARVFCVDETQDLPPLGLALADHWGAQAEHYLIAGDGAQTLYQFLGAEPDALVGPVDPTAGRVLSQSYRLPRSVQELAERWLAQHSPPMMIDRVYRPTGDEGMVEWRALGPDDGGEIAEAVLADAALGSVMVLTCCRYQLQGITAALRAAGAPYHNPYRPAEAAWNPLGDAGRHGTATTSRWRALLRLAGTGPPLTAGDGPWEPCTRCGERHWWLGVDGFWLCERCDGMPPSPTVGAAWDAAQIKAWVELFKNDAFLGSRSDVVALERLTLPEAHRFLVPAVVDAMATGRLGQLKDLLYARFTKALPYLAAVCRHGVEPLYETPTITVGTVHSTKGGEAQSVYLLPHLSPAGAAERVEAGPDGCIRQRYVGMTRAKESLTLCVGRPKSWGSVPVEAAFKGLQL